MSGTKSGKLSMGRVLVVVVLLATVVVSATAGQASADTFTINSLADEGDANPGDGVCHTGTGLQTCTLRAAIDEANASPGDDVIQLPPAAIRLSSGTPLVVANGAVQLVPARSSTITVAQRSQISGGNLTRIFVVDRGGSLALRGVELINGSANPPKLVRSGGKAGKGASFVKAGVDGGAIWVGSTGSVDLDRVVVRRNRAKGAGALFVATGGRVQMVDTRIVGNRSDSTVGGIDNRGTLTVAQSEISSNFSQQGTGGLDNRGTAILINTTVSRNKTSSDARFPAVAAILNRGILDVNSSTIALNETGNAPGSLSGGIATLPGSRPETRITNSMIAYNTTYAASPFEDCALNLSADSHHNLITIRTGCGLPNDLSTWIIGSSPRFDADGPNGGHYGHPTRGWHLASDSPAIDNGYDPSVDNIGRACPATDQLGRVRSGCDLGALEYIG